MEINEIKTGMLIQFENEDFIRLVIGSTAIAYSTGGGLSRSNWTIGSHIPKSEPNKYTIKKVWDEPSDGLEGLCAGMHFWLYQKNFLDYTTELYSKD